MCPISSGACNDAMAHCSAASGTTKKSLANRIRLTHASSITKRKLINYQNFPHGTAIMNVCFVVVSRVRTTTKGTTPPHRHIIAIRHTAHNAKAVLRLQKKTNRPNANSAAEARSAFPTQQRHMLLHMTRTVDHDCKQIRGLNRPLNQTLQLPVVSADPVCRFGMSITRQAPVIRSKEHVGPQFVP